MKKMLDEVTELLKEDDRLVSNNNLLKNKIMELTLKQDEELIELLISNERVKEHFFTEVNDSIVFDKDKFIKFIENKNFLPDSYTTFKNKIGLTSDGEYIDKKKEISLAWPYKDCILEGDQTDPDEDRKEIFWNEILAPDEVDRLKDPKTLTNFKRINEEGEHENPELKEDDNLLIRGNNLLALHSLKKKFRNRVKLIYLDPPYNIGTDEFNYNDKFNHSTWLTFMKNRLEVAKECLKEDGSIFVQIDHHELGYLKVLMDDIFGKENRVQIISIKTASPSGFKAVNPGPIDVTEYILFYTKNRKKYNFKKNYVPAEYHKNYNRIIENYEDDPKNWKIKPLREKIYKENGIEIGDNPQESAKNARKKWGKHWKKIRHYMMAEYARKNPERIVSIRDLHKPTEKMEKLRQKSKENGGNIQIYEKEDGSNMYLYKGGSLAFYSNKIKEINGKQQVVELLTDFWDHISWAGIAKEGGVKLKNGKKPEELIKQILDIGTKKEDLILDFFLGSGTTAAVAHKMDRKYIGIEQLNYGENDPTVRLKNVIEGDQTGISEEVDWKGGGSFVYCELMKWNQEYIDKIQDAEDEEELLDIWEEMQEEAFLSYRVDPEEFEENVEEFKDLSFEDQKRFLIECLDKNHLYVNLSEIKDEEYSISKENKKMNKEFYGGL